jgi:hypothetical protein
MLFNNVTPVWVVAILCLKSDCWQTQNMCRSYRKVTLSVACETYLIAMLGYGLAKLDKIIRKQQ